MRIIDKLNSGKVTLSFEVFPPKKAEDFESIKAAVREISALRPDYVSVTYGAGGGTSDYTAHIASFLEKECGVTALAHLTCISSTRAEVRGTLEKLVELGIQNVLVLRGDIPPGVAVEELPRDYRYAADLAKELRALYPELCIGGACYPEGHVECESQEEDIEHLKAKVEAGCDFLTTQLFFDNSTLYSFLYRIMKKGIDVPVLAGIMPVLSAKQIKRMCRLSGAALPGRLRAMVDKYASDPLAMQQAGIAYATEQIAELVANGIKGIHVYAMNRPDVASKLLENLSGVLGR